MKADELRSLTVEELGAKKEEFQSEVFNLKVQLASGKIENPMRLRIIRRDIARVRTLLKEKGKETTATSKNANPA